jgi:hypothetical protein
MDIIAAALSAAIAIGALVVSVRTARRQHRLHARQTELQARQTELQERLVELETARERDRVRAARRAFVVASIERETRTHTRTPSTSLFLRLSNEGRAGAREIRVFVNGKPLVEDEMIIPGEPEITELGAGATARYFLLPTHNTPPVMNIRLTWVDNSGESGEWTSQLKL